MSSIDLRRVDGIVVAALQLGRGNAMDVPMLETLDRAIVEIAREPPRALVVTGDGGMFSGGLALPALIDLDRAGMASLMRVFAGTMRRLLALPFPTVAAINGHAFAGGCVLAMMCDERVMIEHGAKGPPRIGLNESQLAIGLPAIVIEVARHRLPPTSLVPVVLEGALFTPADARRLGLVDEVVPTDVFHARALARATALASAGPLAYAQIKRALLRPVLATIDRNADDDLESWLDTWFSDEGQRRLRDALARLSKR